MNRRLALVTGASAGIGAAFARVYAAKGWDVALTARREPRLMALADELRLRHAVETFVIPADLAEPEGARGVIDALEAEGRSVDALVNNAGYGVPGGYAGVDWAQHAAFLQVMTVAACELAHRVLPEMIERRFGRIVNVASLAGLIPGGPGATLYGASKAFLIRFSQSLHLEVREHGVHVSALCPGFTISEFHDVTGNRETVRRQTPAFLWQTSEEVAAAGYEAVEANRAIAVPGAPNKAAAALARLIPEDWGMALQSSVGTRIRQP